MAARRCLRLGPAADTAHLCSVWPGALQGDPHFFMGCSQNGTPGDRDCSASRVPGSDSLSLSTPVTSPAVLKRWGRRLLHLWDKWHSHTLKECACGQGECVAILGSWPSDFNGTV